jgi:hypothetical protein
MLRDGMSTAPAFLSWALAVAPVPQSDTDAPFAYAAPVVEADEYTTRAGHRTRWASAKYVLPDGKIAEVFIIADDRASGEATISVDGEAIVSSSYDERRGVTRWISPEPGTRQAAAAAIAAIAQQGSDELLDAFAPDEQLAFPCSDWGKKVLRAGKYIWGSLIVASEYVCCTASAGAGCAVCLIGGWNLVEAGTEALEGYCA